MNVQFEKMLNEICKELNIKYDLTEPLTAKEIIEQFWKTDLTKEELQEKLEGIVKSWKEERKTDEKDVPHS